MRSLIATSFTPSYLTTTPENAPNRQYAQKAYEYVFEQGNSFYPIKIFSASAYHPPASLRYYWTEALVHWTHGDNPMHWCRQIPVAGGIDCYSEGVNNTIFDYNNGGPKSKAHNPYVPAGSYEDSPPYGTTKDKEPTQRYDGSGSGDSKDEDDSKNKHYEGKATVEPEKEQKCATIFSAWCDDAKSDGEQTINEIIDFTISIMTIGMVVLATIGIIIFGYMVMTARDNEAQMTMAKKRILEIVIGVVIWVLIAAIIHLLLPTDVNTSSISGFILPTYYNSSNNHYNS